MITPKVEVEAKTRPTFLPNSNSEYRISPPIDYHKRPYGKAISKGSSSDSSYSSDTSSPVSLENVVVIVRRFFHDDWQKIMHNLKKQTEEDFTYTAFHAENALVNFKSLVPANLLYQNRGWSIVGKYFVRFEKWSYDTHATPKLIPSYEGGTTFRGIPLHIWNMQTFQQIGKACGGLIKVAEEAKASKNLIEVKLKIRYNYSGFLPTNIKIFDEKGNRFNIQTVSHSEGKWLIERNVQLHGTFKRQATTIFDEYNPDSEQFFFDGADAISLDNLSSNFNSRKSITPEKTSALKSVITRIDRNATSATAINEAAYNDNKLHVVDNKSRQGISSRISNDGLLDKGKKKVDIILNLLRRRPK
uniref:DUF4283 domain-containing protein n=1 Tax=Cucumis melo TaxID=3656 RepID=A0A9I9CIB0_CUCME